MMIRYWTNFAARGDPNEGGLPPWPVYEPDQQMVMTFGSDAVSADADLYVRSQCKFWAEQGFGNLAGPYPTPASSGPEYK
jgi:carboxylesterase type B